MAYTPIIAYAPSYGPVYTPNVGDGFTDVGGKYSIQGSGANGVLVHNSTAASLPWQTDQIVRKGAAEQCISQQQELRFQYTDTTASPWLMFRYTATNDAQGTALLVNAVNGQIASLINGSLGNQTGANFSPAGYVQGLFDVRVAITQTNGTTTSITATLWLATAGSAFASGTQLATFTTTTTVAANQNTAGGFGMFWYSGRTIPTGRNIYLWNTYSGDTINAATAYELIGPPNAISTVASSPIFIMANGSLASATTITPSDGGAGGTFNPSTVSLAAGSLSSGTTTYTPSSAGAKTLSAANSGSLTNPATSTLTAQAAPVVVPVSSGAFKFSPGNWKGDTGRGGSGYRQSWNNGAWFIFVWTAGAQPFGRIQLPSSSASNMLSFYLNSVLFDNVAANGPISLSGILPNQTNTLAVYLRNSSQVSRWNNGTNVVQVQGVSIDAAGAAGAAPAANPWVDMRGDSISEGILANAGADNNLFDYTFLVEQALATLGYDTCISACGYSGWLQPGDSSGDVPAYYKVSGSSGGSGGTYNDAASRWNKIDQGVSLLDSNGQISSYGATGTAPAAIYINYMTNEALNGLNLSDSQASVTQALTALRAAAPNAQILIQVPFGIYNPGKYTQTYVAALKAGVAAYKSANPSDSKVTLVDFGASFAAQMNNTGYINPDLVHPLAPGHALVAPMVTNAIVKALTGSGLPNYNYA